MPSRKCPTSPFRLNSKASCYEYLQTYSLSRPCQKILYLFLTKNQLLDLRRPRQLSCNIYITGKLNEVAVDHSYPEERVIYILHVPRGTNEKVVWNRSDLQQLNQNTDGPEAFTANQIIKRLKENLGLKEVTFKFPSRTETRFVLGRVTPYQLVQALKPYAHFAHGSAIYIHGLSSDIPEILQINVEQGRDHSRNRGSLTQVGIDQAFSNKSRVSNEIAEQGGIKVRITHGQKTNGLGVVERSGPNREQVRVTNMERTLIDIAVRPIYAGGPANVLNAYRAARGAFSVKKLADILKTMDFVYPYHQSIGWYLATSQACSGEELKILRQIPPRIRLLPRQSTGQ